MHNEPEAVREISALSLNAKCHLAHVLRNGIALVRASLKQDNEALKQLERMIEDLGI